MRQVFPLLALLTALVALPLAHQQELDLSTVGVHNGVSLAAAFASHVGIILIEVPELIVEDSHFDDLLTPFSIDRNVTIRGGAALGFWPLLTLLAQQKMTLAPGVALHFHNVIVDTPQGDGALRTPNLQILTLSTPGANARLYFGPASALIIAGCFPPAIQIQNIQGTERSPRAPGTQIITVPIPQPGCSNGSSAPAIQRCWPQASFFGDVSLIGKRPDPRGNLQLTHYDWVVVDLISLCRAVVPMECILKLGPAACMLMTVRNSSALAAFLAPPVLIATSSSTAPAGASPPPHKRDTVAIILGSVIGGVALAVAVVGGVHFLRRHQKPVSTRHDSAKRDGLMGGGTAGTALPPPDMTPGTIRTESSRTDLDMCTDPALSLVTLHTPQNPRINLGVRLSPKSAVPASVQATANGHRGSTQSIASGDDLGPYILDDGQDDGESSHRLTLLPVVRGAGACGRVVEGLYGGQRVAVKLLHRGLLSAVAEQQQQHQEAQHAPESSLQRAASPPAAPAIEEQLTGGAMSPSAVAVTAGALLLVPQEASFGTSSCTSRYLGPAGRSEVEASSAGGVAHELHVKRTGSGDGPNQLLQILAQELEVLARLRHPNIIRLLAANLAPPSPCLVLELMDTSLDKLLYGGGTEQRSSGPLPLIKVLHIALQVAQALAYLHPTILHRDLKPANVLISNPTSATPIVKLADFGLSRLQETVLVTARADVGTAAYMAPECLNTYNCVVTHHADMYGFGIMLYEMLAGVRPWEGACMVQIAVAVQERRHRPPLGDLPSQRCPRALRALIEACWDHVPERRPAASEAAKELMLLKRKVAMQAPTSGAEDGAFTAVSNQDRMTPMISVVHVR